MKRQGIVVGQRIDRKALFSGAPLPPALVGVHPTGAIETFADVEDAARRLSNFAVTSSIPLEEGWDGMREMPPMMKKKFERLLEKARAA